VYRETVSWGYTVNTLLIISYLQMLLGTVHWNRPRRPQGTVELYLNSLPSTSDGVSGQRHAPLALPPVTTVHGVEWATERFRTSGKY
jgi:hypothetical protein